MSTATKVETLGQAIADGLMGREAAVQELMEYTERGLTRLGAEHVLDNWWTYRAAMEREGRRAETMLTECLREI